MRNNKELDRNKIKDNPDKKLFGFKHVSKKDKDSSGKKYTKKDEKSANLSKKTKNKKTAWKVFKICLFTFLALCIIGTGVVIGVISGIIDKTPSIDLEELEQFDLASYFYDKDKVEIASINSGENRELVSYKDLPKHLVDAVVSIEDERFFSHNGVDIQRTAAAIFNFIISGGHSDFGGSTITQQLVKNVTEDKEAKWTRKIREWYNSILLESKLTKEQIMESYLNKIFLGAGSSGMQVASKNFFGKNVKDINIAEAAILAAAIQTPESTNPYRSEEARAKLLARQKVVLKQMLKLHKIDQTQYDEAIKFEVAFKKTEDVNNSKIQSYFVDAVIDQVINDLMEQKGMKKDAATLLLYSNGLKIYTTQDTKVQNAINVAYSNEKLFYQDKNKGFMQSAMVVMDQSNGNVLGMMGGADKKTANRTLNRATQIGNQPGSCMKPIGAYGPAFERGLLSPGSGIDDSQITFGNWTPKNYYNYFNGYVTVRQAIAKSMNIPAIRATQKAGVDYSFNFAKNMGLKSLTDKDKGLPSVAIGGGDQGVTVLEMASAYSTIANGGTYMTPKLYISVVDKHGKELLTPTVEAKKVMKDTTSYMLIDCLRTVVTSGTGAGYIRAGNMPVAGKTGNTDNDYDQWFCGFSPYYTIACWNGYEPENKVIGYRKIGSYPYTSMVVFNDVLKEITKGQEVKQFPRPSEIVNGSICKVSGLVATDACKSDPRGNQTITDIFASGTIPTATCNIHKSVSICPDSGLLVTKFCPKPTNKSFITRDYVPDIKPSDWGFMVPIATCNIHTKAPEPIVPESPVIPGDTNGDGKVDIYDKPVVKPPEPKS
ncbi:MAG: transglycosylase domain-containing protein [Clostridia bacterium]